MIDEALFHSLDAALRFAFQPRLPIIDAVKLVGWIGTDKRRRLGGLALLTREEKVAQAALLRSFIDRQPDHMAGWAHARFDLGRGRTGGQQVLTSYAMPRMGGGIVKRRLVYQLVARHYGKQVMLQDLAEQFGVHPNTIGNKVRRVEEVLRAVESEAQSSMTADLVQLGVITPS